MTHGDNLTDITKNHLFLGYAPLIIGISNRRESRLFNFLSHTDQIKTRLGETDNNLIAGLELKKIKTIEFDDKVLFLFEGLNSNHKFLSRTHQFFNNLKYKLTAEKKSNIYLKGNLYDQVKTAYSIPRKILLVTLGMNEMFNVFPTDINGMIDRNNFVISLRTNGKAVRQVKKIKQILLSEMSAESYKEVYSLGANHMKELRPKRELPFGSKFSEKFSLPLPKETLKYNEMEYFNSINLGEHELCFFNVINSEILSDISSTLAHIHRDYAQWRINNGLHSELLFR